MQIGYELLFLLLYNIYYNNYFYYYYYIISSTCGRLSSSFDITGHDNDSNYCYYTRPVRRDSTAVSQTRFNIINFYYRFTHRTLNCVDITSYELILLLSSDGTIVVLEMYNNIIRVCEYAARQGG